MAFNIRDPFSIATARPDAWTFSGLFLLESVARATLVTVLPLTAFAAFGDKEAVSLVYTLVSLAALCVSFAIPVLVRVLSRRWTYTLGAALIGLCAALIGFGAGWAVPIAMLARTCGAAMLNITLSLYIMDNIGRKDLVRSEPLRLGASTFAWSVCPLLGVWLMQRYGAAAPALLSLGAVALLALTFWALRLAEAGPIRPGPTQPGTPLHAIRRFAAQPRMRLAWAIAFARSAFWITFFIYIPILMVEGGLGPTAGGVAVAAGNGMLFSNFFLSAPVARLTLRRVLGWAFFGAAALTLATAALAGVSPAGAGVAMVGAAFFVSAIDGLGPVAFLRAVRPLERPAMTTVYRTYLDASELLPPLAYFFLFMAFGYAGAFAALAVLLAAIGFLTLRYLPRRL